MAVRNQLVEIFQADLIFRNDNLMIGRQLFEVAASDFGVDILRIVNIVIRSQPVAESNEDFCENLRVVCGAVVVELAQTQVIGYRVELDVLDIGQNRARYRDGIDGGIAVRLPHILARLADK